MAVTVATGNGFLSATAYGNVSKQFVNNITSGGSLLVAFVSVNTSSPVTLSCSDDVNGSWTALSSAANSGLVTQLQIFYKYNSASGGKPTVSITGLAAQQSALTIAEFIGVQSSSDPIDGSNSNSVNGGSGNPTSGSFTTTANGLVVGYAEMYPAATPSAGTGYTIGNLINHSSGYPGGTEYKLAATAGSNAAVFGNASQSYWVGVGAAFKAAPAGATTGIFKKRNVHVRQPQYPVQIDKSSPLAKDLIFHAPLHPTWGMVDLVTGAKATKTGLASTRGTNYGTLPLFGASNYADFTVPPNFDGNLPTTFAWVQQPIGASGFVTVFDGRAAVNAGANDFLIYQSDSNTGYYLAIGNRNGGSNAANFYTTVGPLTNNKLDYFVATLTNGINDASGTLSHYAVWRNGVKLNAAAATTIFGSSTATGFRIGGLLGAGGNPFTGALGGFTIWHRVLTDAEAYLMTTNPAAIYDKNIRYLPTTSSSNITTTQTITGTSRITATTTKTETGKARIQVTTTKTETGTSRISIVTTKTETGTARIAATTTKTETGISRIQKVVNQTITGVANIAASTITTTKTITGTGRVQKTVTTTETGTGRIQKLVNATESGTARISITTTKTETGISRIQKVVSATITGVANIASSIITTTKTITGTSRVTATTTRTETGTGRIQKTVSQTVQGVSRIGLVTTKTETGKARVQTVVSQTETGKARITATSSQTITGKARITGSGLVTVPMTQYSVELGSGVSKSLSPTGNMLEIEIVTTTPTSAPVNNRGVVFMVSGGVVTIYVWNGSSWIAK